jgi:hypothetical protein
MRPLGLRITKMIIVADFPAASWALLVPPTAISLPFINAIHQTKKIVRTTIFTQRDCYPGMVLSNVYPGCRYSCYVISLYLFVSRGSGYVCWDPGKVWAEDDAGEADATRRLQLGNAV